MVCLYPLNIKTVKPIDLFFFCDCSHSPRKDANKNYASKKYQNLTFKIAKKWPSELILRRALEARTLYQKYSYL